MRDEPCTASLYQRTATTILLRQEGPCHQEATQPVCQEGGVVYFDKSDLELESDEDGDEASKKRSSKKIANTEPDLLHLPGTSESTHLYTLRALAPVTNSLLQKKKSWSSHCQSSGKENWVSDVKMGSKAETALTFEREVHEVKMHASPKKRTKAVPGPTIKRDVPCTSLPVDEDNERSDWIKIICDPMTTSMKIPTMQ
jgi:hypothetical protein